ncbi:hypothetical protein PCAR4_1360002 [Paraburkholderia caribensis]|nr:hypothetical protein PCAR4_1360002 [Paraburkholderia caribensis]
MIPTRALASIFHPLHDVTLVIAPQWQTGGCALAWTVT